ncbi:hypothetical protein AKJ65_05775 [candidate division MSBL1 archaeon SCGC-AAA259E19]|uniref:Uncharacterized protein n=1 Tax=candidate division MSBL1 archaeon SCGC-AAA259E19 TaxID=1698264 RepID=A0A133UI89_9EURY|nr:hypothetical protein AKJ65_05775 [candidate division MSBL1 archaeon SCGC-AAA259E19]
MGFFNLDEDAIYGLMTRTDLTAEQVYAAIESEEDIIKENPDLPLDPRLKKENIYGLMTRTDLTAEQICAALESEDDILKKDYI